MSSPKKNIPDESLALGHKAGEERWAFFHFLQNIFLSSGNMLLSVLW